MERLYLTSEIARDLGVHPNTVRLYEKLQLIPEAKRLSNNYRVYSDRHIDHFVMARTALQVEVLQNNLRKNAINIVKVAASGDYEIAMVNAEDYRAQIRMEIQNAEDAIRMCKDLMNRSSDYDTRGSGLKRKEAAIQLDVTIDTLRNWEMNGLLSVKRKDNGYRIYSQEDMIRLRIIRSLRCANYSLASILRMLNAIQKDPNADITTLIDTVDEEDDIFSACDKLLTSLNKAESNASKIIEMLQSMKCKYITKPLL
ncbi:MAG: MerR family transcriptional regulator [Clostridiaceae bacterium]|nr:MerR family transcriptional regulator [Clostridiaceae bacterium]